ncbi:MAG: hypothetical protein HPY53_07015 [Brevinematales bacterium]|nr:hypothetical protein [Brevinematales bacterium]
MRPVARMCYDHLSGVLGEALYNALFRNGFLIGGDKPELTSHGEEELVRIGIDLTPLKTSPRKIVNACMERDGGKMYPHIGSHLGGLLLNGFISIGWLTQPDANKDMTITPAGREGFSKLGIYLPAGM